MKYAVLFDMDGLMFDTERLLWKARDYAGEKLGIGKAGYMTVRVMGRKNDDYVEEFQKEFGEKYDDELFWRYTREYLNDFREHNIVPCRPGLFELIRYLKENGVKTAVASSTRRQTVERYITQTGLMESFDALICGDMVENSKPAPDVFLKAAEAIGMDPKDCFVLEDSRNGVLAGCAAGCRTILVPDLYVPDEEILSMVEYCGESLISVKEYFEKIF